MLARGSLAHWAAAKTSARDLPQLARFLSHTLCARRASDVPVARAISRAYVSALNARRSYATAAAATKPTVTVKKAVKAQAQSSARPKRAAASKTTSKPAKKPMKKATAKKTKPKAKPKPKAKKKPAPKKKVPRKKKVPTPEEKLKADIRELRKTALKAPVTMHTVSAYNVFLRESMKNRPKTDSPVDTVKVAAQRYKETTPAEREHYNHLANEATAAKHAEYKAWITSHTPLQIYKANNARIQLRRKLPKRKRGQHAHTESLKDDRLPKRGAQAYTIFSTERWASGDLKGITVRDASKMVAEEWKALSAGEKKKYEDMQAADTERYRREAAAAFQSA